MEVAHSTPENFTETYRQKTPLPLRQLEGTRQRADVPHHLLESKIYAKLQGNSIIHAEPSELHFSGFELGKDYCQVLKLINISSDVINIHIIPTQTKYFHTEYSKKHRLIPGLSYTVEVNFCPDEWRYFYDCVRVHCKESENLLVPVHAYPIIDDLQVPSQVNLPAVPLGQSCSHVIPLRCSCPIEFEFQVYVIQQHKAFTVQPLSGVIPANGKVELLTTFRPFQYGTSQVTLQVVISQFNSKPHVCTITGTSSPRLALRHSGQGVELADGPSTEDSRLPPDSLTWPHTKAKLGSIRSPQKTKAVKEQKDARVEPSLKSKVDMLTPAGVAKMLMQPTDRLCSKDLREAMSHSKLGQQTRQMKEAFFENKVRQNVQEERANHLRWQTHLGKDPVSAQTKSQISEEKVVANHEYMVRKGEVKEEGDFATGQPKLETRRVTRNVGQAPAVSPTFRVDTNSQLEVRHRALRGFQQAARKVVMRCRMNNRLVSLRQQIHGVKTSSRVSAGGERRDLLKVSPEKVFPSTFPIFSLPDQDDELAPSSLGAVPTRPIKVVIKPQIPFFSLKVPQHYKLVGYQPVNVYEAMANYIPPDSPRTLRTGAQDELLPTVVRPPSPSTQADPVVHEDADREETPGLSFTAPQAILNLPYSHPLRIFNPVPGLHAFRPAPLYLENEPESHLCPMPKYPVQKSGVVDILPSTAQKKLLDRVDVIPGVVTWKKFPSAALAALSSTPTLTSNWAPHMSDCFNADILPSMAPPALRDIPDDMVELLDDGPCESLGISLTPEMVRAVFPMVEMAPSKHTKEGSGKDDPRECGDLEVVSDADQQTGCDSTA